MHEFEHRVSSVALSTSVESEVRLQAKGGSAMGILGLTHDENGAALERLPVTIGSKGGLQDIGCDS